MMARKVSRNRPTNTAIETGPMSLPKMDRPSVALAWFLDSMEVEFINETPVLTCTLCGVPVCDVDDGDTLRVLFNTALAHTCEV